MDSDDHWNHRPTRMRVEYVDGGESSIHSSSLNSSQHSSGEDGSPNSLPEVYEPHIPPFELIDRTNITRPPSISSSSSSTTTSSGELFQIVPREVVKKGSSVGDPSATVMTISAKHKADETSSEATPTPKTEHSPDDDEFIVLGELSPTQSPPVVQVMNRSSTASHDPHRIPAAAFEPSTSIADGDWSNASNDSLFSIRLENGSFVKERIRSKAWRRDSAIRPKRELTLTPDRWSKPPSTTSSPPSEEVADKVEKSPEEEEMRDKCEGNCPTVVEKENAKIYPIEEAKATLDEESANHSDKNGVTGEDYSHDGKKKKSDKKSSKSWCLTIFPCLSWPSWCFNTCCRPLCCSCKWPSCKCGLSSCSCCKCSLAFCFCEHPCYSRIGMAIRYTCSCKPLKLLCCCISEPNNKEHATEEQGDKKGGGYCSCFSCGSCCCSFTSCFSSCSSCFSCRSCCSCNSCFSCQACSCKSCSSCFSCGSCCSCKSCTSCFSCGPCLSCCRSCFSCDPCRSCFSCGSCSCFTCKCSFACCSSHWWRPCRPHCC